MHACIAAGDSRQGPRAALSRARRHRPPPAPSRHTLRMDRASASLISLKSTSFSSAPTATASPAARGWRRRQRRNQVTLCGSCGAPRRNCAGWLSGGDLDRLGPSWCASSVCQGAARAPPPRVVSPSHQQHAGGRTLPWLGMRRLPVVGGQTRGRIAHRWLPSRQGFVSAGDLKELRTRRPDATVVEGRSPMGKCWGAGKADPSRRASLTAGRVDAQGLCQRALSQC